MKKIRKYLILTEQSLQSSFAYRVPFFMTLLAGLIQALVLYSIWFVVFRSRDTLSGFTFAQMTTYIFVSYGVKNLYSFYTEAIMCSSIRDGSVATELIKPLNYQLARFFESLGSVAVEGLFVVILVVAVGFGLFSMKGPASATAAVLFVLSAGIGLLISFCISYIVGLVSFWTTSVYGIINSKRFIMDFLSGGLIPLVFFPPWLRSVAGFLPFPAVVHLPVSIYLGTISGSDAVRALAQQGLWAVGLWLLGHALWSRAVRQVTIFGG